MSDHLQDASDSRVRLKVSYGITNAYFPNPRCKRGLGGELAGKVSVLIAL